jgi:DNA recombination-dependent growth factor C
MGFMQSTVNFTRFQVEDFPPEDYMESFPEKIARHSFRDIDENSLEERSEGWVNIMDMLDSDFPAMEYFKEPYLAMSWRVDTRRVPSKALKRYTGESEKEIKAREGLQYLPKKRREEIREHVRLMLLKRVIASSEVYDMVWNLSNGLLLFGATSVKLCDEFRSFFLKTFECRMTPVYPYSLGERVLKEAGKDPNLLYSTRASVFVRETRP